MDPLLCLIGVAVPLLLVFMLGVRVGKQARTTDILDGSGHPALEEAILVLTECIEKLQKIIRNAKDG